ncbi:MAG: PSD1 and planctomycete cytochrome C domain-containing protein [Planctomycetaceae bacterium]
MSRTIQILLIALMPCGTSLAADPEAIKFFESKVRPVLVTRCLKCHGPTQQKGKLRLDSREALLKGGESGEVIVSGKPDESLLIEAINRTGLEMPPDAPLKENEIAALTEWVRRGLPWPTVDGKSRMLEAGGKGVTAADKQYWAFQPINDPDVPSLTSQISNPEFPIRNPIDAFIAACLQAEGMTPAPEADRRTLIRRLTFDLTGLPPTPVEIAEFEKDSADDAYERLVDRLLDSPAYGERWARHWLDLVRYAESDGYRKDDYRPNAWRYRDYVVRSFQTDKPFDRFVQEQIAGDEIAPDNPDALAATGYLRLSLYEYNQRDARTQWNEILNDITDVTGDVFLGFGMGCARCHDHKFDPILQKDYFRLRAFFAGIQPRDTQPLATKAELDAHQAQLAEWEAKTADIRAKLAELEKPHFAKMRASAIFKFPAEIQAILKTDDVSTLSPLDRQLYDLAYRQVQYEHDQIGAKLKDESKKKWDDLRAELKKFDDLKPAPLPIGCTVTDVGPIAPPTVIPGDKSETDIAPGLLSVLDDSPTKIVPLATAPNSSGRRAELARWLTSPGNPLTPRVMVNRIWQYHFGKGLVATSSDFGRLGESPSHPELLDWLASQFAGLSNQNSKIKNQKSKIVPWSIKSLHRLIVTSATYRQSAANPRSEPQQLKDPTNRLLWRANIRRLDAEQIRDSMLLVSGKLDTNSGGPSVPASKPRRSIYTEQRRNSPDPLLDVFDSADGFSSTPERNVTTTPTQALMMINSKSALSHAAEFARRVKSEGGSERESQVATAYRLAFGREATAVEVAAAIEFLNRQAAQNATAASAVLTDFCHVLLNSNEFLYVD